MSVRPTFDRQKIIFAPNCNCLALVPGAKPVTLPNVNALLMSLPGLSKTTLLSRLKASARNSKRRVSPNGNCRKIDRSTPVRRGAKCVSTAGTKSTLGWHSKGAGIKVAADASHFAAVRTRSGIGIPHQISPLVLGPRNVAGAREVAGAVVHVVWST